LFLTAEWASAKSGVYLGQNPAGAAVDHQAQVVFDEHAVVRGESVLREYGFYFFPTCRIIPGAFPRLLYNIQYVRIQDDTDFVSIILFSQSEEKCSPCASNRGGGDGGNKKIREAFPSCYHLFPT
jgi:hypothetical protein